MNMRKKAIGLILLTLVFTSYIYFSIQEACSRHLQASSFLLDNKNSKVVMILLDHIMLEDIKENEYLSRFFDQSMTALVSGRQNGKSSSTKAKLTIGASKRLELSGNLRNAISLADNIQSNEVPRTGQPENVQYQDINSLRNQNKGSDYKEFIGYLGSSLRASGKKTCVIGNSDSRTSNRSAVLIAMNQEGIVDYGDVDSVLMSDYTFPGGQKTNFAKLLKLYDKYYKSADFIVIDTGDLARLESFGEVLGEDSYKRAKKRTIEEIAQFIKEAATLSEPNTSFVLLSTYPSEEALQTGFRLTPMAFYESSKSGLLYSSSTKRNGIITSLDIADFILEQLQVKEKSSLKEVPQSNVLDTLLQMKERLLTVSQMRLPVLTWYAIFEIMCATLGFLYIIRKDTRWSSFAKLIKLSMLANIIAPGVLLYMSLFSLQSKVLYFTTFLLISFALAALIFKIQQSSTMQFLIGALFVNVSIIIDLLRGSALIKNSVFGYDPIIGARFYGIGNEYAGVYIGSGILLAGCIIQVCRSYVEKRPGITMTLVFAYTAAQLYMIGMPFLGANFGGTIAAIVAYFFFFSSVWQKKIRIKQLLLLLLILFLCLTIIVVLDLNNPAGTTHVGKFIKDIRENGLKVLIATFTRKAAMNLRLIKYTIWTKVLLCIILIITIMFFKPVKLLHSIFKKYRYLAAAWVGISAGSIAGLIVNDSGIVVAATAMIFTGYTILYKCLEESEIV